MLIYLIVFSRWLENSYRIKDYVAIVWKSRFLNYYMNYCHRNADLSVCFSSYGKRILKESCDKIAMQGNLSMRDLFMFWCSYRYCFLCLLFSTWLENTIVWDSINFAIIRRLTCHTAYSMCLLCLLIYRWLKNSYMK